MPRITNHSTLLGGIFAAAILLSNAYAQSTDTSSETAAPLSAQETDENAIDLIVVIGRPIENYAASDALTGTKTNALLQDLPLAVSVVPQELIVDRSLSYLGEALDSVSGAQRKQGYGGTQNFGAFLRGFDASFLTLRNGVRDFGFYTLRDAANVERFEVLKGPGSVLYGALRPGGITNTITKQPTADPLGRVSAIAGSYDRYRIEGDFGGPVTDQLFFRFNAAAEDAESFRDEVGSDGYFLAPVVTWRPNDRLQWTWELEHKQTDFTWDLGLPRNEVSFDVPVSRFLGEPDGINDVRSTIISSTINYAFNGDWSIRQVTSYAETSGDYKLRSAFAIDDDGRTAIRSAFDTDESSSTLGVVNDVIGEFEAFGLDHQLVVGADFYEIESSFFFDFRTLAPIDVFEPVYGGALGDPFPLFAEDNKDRSYGVYIQDLISIGERWKVLAGLRHDWNDYRAIDTLGEEVSRDTDETAFSPQFGVVYQPDADTSLYANYSSSFQPVRSGAAFDGATLEPEEGEQFEIGVKRSWFDGRLSSSLALFDITKENVNTTDPDNPLFIIQTGEQSSRGVELDIAGSPLPGWNVIFGGAYIDAEVTEDNRIAVGSGLPGAPEWSASLWSKYSVQDGPLRGLELGGGVFYVDEREASLPNNVVLPSYVRLDAFASYPLGDADLQLNVKNITDEDIYDLTSTSILPQEPITVSLRLSYNFFGGGRR